MRLCPPSRTKRRSPGTAAAVVQRSGRQLPSVPLVAGDWSCSLHSFRAHLRPDQSLHYGQEHNELHIVERDH